MQQDFLLLQTQFLNYQYQRQRFMSKRKRAKPSASEIGENEENPTDSKKRRIGEVLDDLKNKHGITDRDILAYFKSEFGTSKSSSSKETVGGNAGDASGEQSSSEDDDSDSYTNSDDDTFDLTNDKLLKDIEHS